MRVEPSGYELYIRRIRAGRTMVPSWPSLRRGDVRALTRCSIILLCKYRCRCGEDITIVHIPSSSRRSQSRTKQLALLNWGNFPGPTPYGNRCGVLHAPFPSSSLVGLFPFAFLPSLDQFRASHSKEAFLYEHRLLFVHFFINIIPWLSGTRQLLARL